jgi:hypothetical protein
VTDVTAGILVLLVVVVVVIAALIRVFEMVLVGILSVLSLESHS